MGPQNSRETKKPAHVYSLVNKPPGAGLFVAGRWATNNEGHKM